MKPELDENLGRSNRGMHEKLARLIEAHRDYVTALLANLANPATADAGVLRRRSSPS
jgi:hypothetical protein